MKRFVMLLCLLLGCEQPQAYPQLELLWSFDIPREDGYGSDLKDGLLIGSIQLPKKPYEVLGFDLASRSTVFRQTFSGGDLFFAGYGGLATWEDKILLQQPVGSHAVAILNRQGKKIRDWQLPYKTTALIVPLINHQSTVYLTSSHTVTAFDWNQGLLWEKYFESPEGSGIDDTAFDEKNGILYVATQSTNNPRATSVYALNTGGQMLWERDLGAVNSGFRRRATLAAYAGGVAVAQMGKGSVEVYTTEGLIKTTTSFVCDETNVMAKPIIVDQVLYGSPDGDHCLFAIDLATGRKKWDFKAPFPGTFGNTPTVVNGVVYAANRRIYAIEAQTGKLLATSSFDDEALQFERGQVHYDAPRHQLVLWGNKIYAFKPVR
jgi:hypothetical protein